MKTGCEHVSDKGLLMFLNNLKLNVWRVALGPRNAWMISGPKGEVPPAQAAVISAGMREVFEAEARKRKLKVWDIDDPDDPCVSDLLSEFQQNPGIDR